MGLWSKFLNGGGECECEAEVTCIEVLNNWLLSKVDKGDFFAIEKWLWRLNSFLPLLLWIMWLLSRESRLFLGGAAGLGVKGGSAGGGGGDERPTKEGGGWARPWILRLVAVAKRSSNSLLGTCTLPQYMNCSSLSKCTGDTSFKKTTGWRSGLLGLGGCLVSMSLKRGLQAHSTSLKNNQAQCLKSAEKSLTNSASVASYVYILKNKGCLRYSWIWLLTFQCQFDLTTFLNKNRKFHN